MISSKIIEDQIKKERPRRIYLVVSNPEYKSVGDELVKWLNDHYKLIEEKRYYHDPEFARKARLMKKEFMEYRIRIFIYKGG